MASSTVAVPIDPLLYSLSLCLGDASRVATLLGKRLSFCLLCYSGCLLVGKEAVILLIMLAGLPPYWERGRHFACYASRVGILLGKRLSFCLLCYSGCHLAGKDAVILLIILAGLPPCWERGCHFAYYASRVATLLGKRLSFCLLC